MFGFADGAHHGAGDTEHEPRVVRARTDFEDLSTRETPTATTDLDVDEEVDTEPDEANISMQSAACVLRHKETSPDVRSAHLSMHEEVVGL